ncbi:MAG: DEAD/DEAH box helicase family protein, partial [Deltaproteobacteria bacterium]|nr:DEAD/DEAH box helicase family protein [Deltaproteobacteria bacterium]
MEAIFKQEWLNQLSRHLSEDDWLAGIELYRDNKIIKVNHFEQLIYGNIRTFEGKQEVRLKLHPNGKMIQWVECTCPRNRKKGTYCEHIAALFLHLHQERDGIFPQASKIPFPLLTKTIESEHGKLLHSVCGSILKIKEKETKLLAEFEMKEGQASQLEIPIDDQPSFLSSLSEREKKLLPVRYQKLSVRPQSVTRGVHITLDEKKTVVARKVWALDTKGRKIATKLRSLHERCTLITPEGEKSEQHTQTFSSEATARWAGKHFLLIPEHGYVKLGASSPKWEELSAEQSFTDKDASKLLIKGFDTLFEGIPVFLSKALTDLDIVSNIELCEIKVLKEKNGWFYLDPRYKTGNSSTSMLSLIREFAKAGSSFVKTNNSWVKIPELIRHHEWKIDAKNKCLKVNNLDLIRLRSALGHFDKFVGKKSILKKIQESTEQVTVNNLPSLDHTKLHLREYQKRGLEWLWWLRSQGLHGLLADDMGLGKTHQAMAIMSAIQGCEKPKKETQFLIVCPTTVIDHWLDKIQTFAPNLKPLKYHGARREMLHRNFSEHGAIITSYGVLLRDIALLEHFQWQCVILDEAHFVKNNKSATYKAACRLNAKFRLGLSGTPMENRLDELKNIFDFIVPGYLGSDRYFLKKYITPILKQDARKEQELQLLLHPLKLRRTKEQVLSDLPDKVEDTRFAWLSDEQAKLYRDILNTRAKPIIQSLQDEKQTVSYLHVLTVLQLLKQVCDHPALILKSADWQKHESGKFEILKELLAEALESNQKVVIYSQYLGM